MGCIDTQHSVKHIIGSIIRHHRKKKGMTQKELGELIGKTGNQISMYEKGESDISISLLTDISIELQIEPPIVTLDCHSIMISK